MCQTKSFYLWFLQVVVLTGLLALFLWLSLRPKDPNYTITDFTFPVDNSSQNTTLAFDLEIGNPNKDSSIYYNNINITLYYGDNSIGSTTILAFNQRKSGTFQTSRRINADGRLWKEVYAAVSKGKAELRVSLVTAIRYRTWFWKSKHHGMHLQGRVPIGSDGKISGKKKKIKLRHSKKWRFKG